MGRPLKLIAGLGNPGAKYADTRHNAGAWFVVRVADAYGATFKEEKKFFGSLASASIGGSEVKLLLPSTYMNESGKSVGAIARFYKIEPGEILIAHDELDLAMGVARFKHGGGLAGHNGLRDISASLGGSQDFGRLRIGVGHPGDKSSVTGHVLGKTPKRDREAIEACIEEALRHLPLAVEGDWNGAMNALNGFRAGAAPEQDQE